MNKYALLIIDMINDFDFKDGEILFKNSLPIAHQISFVKKEAKKRDIPVIYVNDNFGRWKSSFEILIEHCIKDNTIGKEIVELLLPDKDDYFVLKPMLSSFYSTTLELILKYLKVDTLIIVGIKTESCVLSSIIDAYMRNYKVIVLKDCVTTIEVNQEYLFDIMKNDFKADVIYSEKLFSHLEDSL